MGGAPTPSGIQEESKVSSTPKQKEASPTEQLIARLGTFVSNDEVLNQPFTTIECITDWKALYHRYKPENIPFLEKAVKC